MKIRYYLLIAIFYFSACVNPESFEKEPITTSPQNGIPPIIGYSIVKTYPHDTTYFTEGLEFFNEKLYESSGGNNDESPYPSSAGIVNLNNGKIDTKIILDKSKHFGEGITFFGDKLYMLTWKSGVGFVYDAQTFKKIKEFKLPPPEAWGLTHDSSSLIMSNGSNSLHYLDPLTLQVKNIVGVIDNNGPVSNINELEYVDGYIYANQWQTSYILKIEAATGKVVGRIDLSRIDNDISPKFPNTYGLNGIAYNPQTGNFLIVGKKWPFIYEIKLQ